MDNLAAHKNKNIRPWAAANQVTLLFTPTYASWANPIVRHDAACSERETAGKEVG